MTKHGKRAIILGAGPAGLAVAEACRFQGVDVAGIFTAPIELNSIAQGKDPISNWAKKSEMYGAQFLHGSLHRSRVKHSEPFWVTYKLDGTAESYRAKVYGRAPVKVSAEKYPDGHQMLGWDIREMYDQLWNLWEGWMTPVHLTPAFIQGLCNEADGKAHIISTIPRWLTCKAPEQHTFASQRIYAVGDSETFPLRPPMNTIQMSGSPDCHWYRMANIMGHTTVEWPGSIKPPVEGVVPVRKPLWTDCDCWDGQPVGFLGRYGQWKKSVLVHSVYDDAQDIASGMRIAQV